MRRLVVTLFAVWWVATPSVCGAFLTLGCGPGFSLAKSASSASNDPSVAPCHQMSGSSRSAVANAAPDRSTAPVVPLQGEGEAVCCPALELAASSSTHVGAAPQSEIASVLLADFGPAIRLPSPLDRDARHDLHSPYLRNNPPLLN